MNFPLKPRLPDFFPDTNPTQTTVLKSTLQMMWDDLTRGLNSSLSVDLVDTHANRLALYSGSNVPAVGTSFYETDRTLNYIVVLNASVPTWIYAAGQMISTFAARPTGLGTVDTGLKLKVITGTAGVIYNHSFIWTGVAWIFDGDYAGLFIDAPINPGGGYHPCDGTTTKYLSVGADLSENAFTTPDEITTPGVYHKSIAIYAGTINAASSLLTFTGTLATLTGSVSTPTFSGTLATLTGTVASNSFTVAGTALVSVAGTTPAITTFNGTVIVAGSNTVNTPNPTLTINSYTPAGTISTLTLTMNGYTPAGTISGTAESRNLGVLRYFRR